MSVNPKAPLQDMSDEINLVDLWRIFVKRRRIVIAMLVLSLLVGAGYWVYTPFVYDSRAVLQVGQVGQDNVIEQPELLELRLKEKYKQHSDDMPRMTQINIDKKGLIVVFLAQDRTAAGAQQYLNRIMHDLLAEHDKMFHQVADIERQHLDSLGQKLARLDTISRKLSPSDPPQMKPGQTERFSKAIETGKLIVGAANIIVGAANIEDAYTKLHIALGDSLTYPTRVLSKPTMAVAPSKPNAKQLLVMALLFGTIGGIFIAFFVEFLARFRAQLRDHEYPTDNASGNHLKKG